MATNYAEENESPLDVKELLENPYRLALEQEKRNNGIAHLSTFLNRSLNQWQQEPLNIAIIGEAGVGKSTLINTMRGLLPNHPQAAYTSGQGMNTIDMRSYPDLSNPCLTYFDLPGIGTADVDRRTYITTNSLSKYDFFIVLCTEGFTNNEIYLGKEIQQMQKQFYFVQTRIDRTLQDARDDADKRGQSFNDNAYIEQIKKICQANFQKHLPGQHRLFVISGRLNNYTKWDFPDLVQALIHNAPGLKREALLFSIRANSHDIIEQKAKKLQQRIFVVATLSVGVNAVPVPGLSFACDISIVVKELRHYMIQFGINDSALLRLSNISQGTLEWLQQAIFGINTKWSSGNAALLELATNRLASYVVANPVEKISTLIPVIGQTPATKISFCTVYGVLRMSLKELTAAAHRTIDQFM